VVHSAQSGFAALGVLFCVALAVRMDVRAWEILNRIRSYDQVRHEIPALRVRDHRGTRTGECVLYGN
jgi:hypothetical protein